MDEVPKTDCIIITPIRLYFLIPVFLNLDCYHKLSLTIIELFDLPTPCIIPGVHQVFIHLEQLEHDEEVRKSLEHVP